MKNLYTLIVTLLPLLSFSQGEYKFQFGLLGAVDIPLRYEMPKMGANYGAGLHFAYKPINRVPVFLELKGNVGMYDYRTSTETFVFDETSSTETDVTFKSSMHKIQFGTKIYFSSFYRPVRGYITPQIGYSFIRSRVRIADPEDVDDCQPLSNKISHRSSGLTYGGELGMEIDLMRLIKGDEGNNSRLFVSVSYLGSAKTMDYVNTRYMNEHEHGVHQHDGNQEEDGRPLTAEFINLTNNDLHEHKIAEIYNTYLRYVNVNIGYVWYF